MNSPSSAASEGANINGLMPVDAVADLIRAGASLTVAGRKSALDRLPAGQWIGGTSPYFMTLDGGRVVSDDELFVTDLGALGEVTVTAVDVDELESISGNAPDHGISIAIIPAGSACHEEFARNAGTYPDAFLKPTVGWIAGHDLSEPASTTRVYDGRTALASDNCIVVAHIALPLRSDPQIEIVNIFHPDGQDVIRFYEPGFAPHLCEVNGEQRNFADYVRERGRQGCDLPLVGDFAGARINASLKSATDIGVDLYAPVFPGVDYAFATPVGDYAGAFREALAAQPLEGAAWSCNCILNFLFGKLDGVAIGGVAGPVTFGEIAYQLLNQTMVIVRSD